MFDCRYTHFVELDMGKFWSDIVYCYKNEQESIIYYPDNTRLRVF